MTDQQQRLINAILRNEHRTVSKICNDEILNTPNRKSVDLNKCDEDYGETPLYLAAEKGKFKIVKILCEVSSVDINKSHCDGTPPLVGAVRAGYTEIVKHICSLDEADVNKGDKDGETPLISAARRGNIDLVTFLSKHTRINVNQGNRFGNTPLIAAVMYNQSDIVRYLCSLEKVDINMGNKIGYTPLINAVLNMSNYEYGKPEIVQFLSSHERIDLNKRDNMKKDALSYAMQEGHGDIIMILCSHDELIIDRNEWDYQWKNENLEYQPLDSEIYCYPIVAKIALSENFFDVNWQNMRGHNLLHIAVIGNNKQLLEQLCFNNRTLVNMSTNDGVTPLMAAVQHKNLNFVKCLCTLNSNSIDVNAGDMKENTAFHHAAINGKQDGYTFFKELVSYFCGLDTVNFAKMNKNDRTVFDIFFLNIGKEEENHRILTTLRKLALKTPEIDISKQNLIGNTLLHMAVTNEDAEALKYLSNFPGASNIENNKKFTPFDLAKCSSTCPQSFLLYLYKLPGSNIDSMSINDQYRNGKTLLHIAVEEGNRDALEELHRHEGIENVKDNNINTPFRLVVESGKYPAFLLFLYNLPGADMTDINDKYQKGQTLLHLAVRESQDKIVKSLLQNNSDINVDLIDDDGMTCLQYAVQTENLDAVKLLAAHKAINPNFPYNDKSPLTLAIEINSFDIAEFLLTLSDIDIHLNFKSIQRDETVFQLLRRIVEHRKEDIGIENSDRKQFEDILQIYLTSGTVSLDIPNALVVLLSLKDKVSPVMEYLRKIIDNSYHGEVLRTTCTAILNVIVIGLQKYADHERLKYSFFKSTVYKTLVQIVAKTESHVENSEYFTQLLNIVYISLQANNSCTIADTDFLKNAFDGEHDVLKLFKKRITQIASTERLDDCADLQLLAVSIFNLYINMDQDKGCSTSIRAYLKRFEKCLSKCFCCPKCFHKCTVRGDLEAFTRPFDIIIHVADFVLDAIVGTKTLTGFSRSLGIFMIVLVFLTLSHENIRSIISSHETEKERLQILLGKIELEWGDWEEHSHLHSYFNQNRVIKHLLQFFWPYKVEGSRATRVRAFMFNLISIFFLRPVVDRLTVLTHFPSNKRVIYRQQFKEKSLNQYYMVLEQIPQLLIQFYIFQIYFNIIRPNDNPGCLKNNANGQSFESYNDTEYFYTCEQNLLRFEICASWWEIVSIVVPFVTIPYSMVCLEEIFRKLHPASPDMTTASKWLLYLAYIIMIPSRLFLYAAMMHSFPDNMIIIGYIILVTFVWFIVNVYVIMKGEHEEIIVRHGKWFSYTTIGNIWSLIVFSFRDVMLISLREPIAYIMKPSEVTYKTLRNWKWMIGISFYYFVEGLFGAVYIEHYYPCGMESDIFKYQGWFLLLLLILSSTLITLLSYVLQPLKMNVIHQNIYNRSVIICGFGLGMGFIATLTFFASPRHILMERMSAIIVTAIFMVLFLSAVWILAHYGEARPKKNTALNQGVLVYQDVDSKTQNCSRCCFLCNKTGNYSEVEVGSDTGSANAESRC